MTTSKDIIDNTNDCSNKAGWQEAVHIQDFISAMAAGSIDGLSCVLDQKLLTLITNTIPCERDLITKASEFAKEGELAHGYDLDGSSWACVYDANKHIMREGVAVLAKRDNYNSFLDYIKMGLEFYGISDYDSDAGKYVDIEGLLEEDEANSDTEKEVRYFATYFMGVQLLVYVLEAYTSHTTDTAA